MTTPEESSPSGQNAPAQGAMLARELSEFLVELSIAMHKHAIYPPGHPLLESAVDAVARKLWALLAERASLSIGVARKQLVIEGVATDSHHPLLQELAQKLHRHQLGALKLRAGVQHRELSEMLATIAVDASRMERPLGMMTGELAARWEHVRLFPLSYDLLELLDDESNAPVEHQMGSGRAAQLWVGLARAALVVEATGGEPREADAPLEPAMVARAIDEHQREQAYDQVIVGYMLQIANEIKAGEGASERGESAALTHRISRMVGALRSDTLSRLLEMGGDSAQRRRFVLDATQGMTVDAVLELVKAAAEAERQTVSHSMMRMLSKMAQHASGGTDARRAVADRSLREAVGKLVSEWSLDDPNPEAYRAALEQASLRAAARPATPNEQALLACEPARIVQMALEVGVTGPALWRAVDTMVAANEVAALLALLDGAPSRATAASIEQHLACGDALERVLSSERPDLGAAERLVRYQGVTAVPLLLAASEMAGDAKTRERILDLVAKLGAPAMVPVAEQLAEIEARAGAMQPSVQRELLALLVRISAAHGPLPESVDVTRYQSSGDAIVRREALKLLLRGATRDAALVAALHDPDDRVVYVALTAAQERCPREGMTVLRGRVERGEMDAKLRALAIRTVATLRTPDTLRWLVGRATVRSTIFGRLRLAAPTPETLAALSAIAAGWRNDPAAIPLLALAGRAKDPAYRAFKLA